MVFFCKLYFYSSCKFTKKVENYGNDIGESNASTELMDGIKLPFTLLGIIPALHLLRNADVVFSVIFSCSMVWNAQCEYETIEIAINSFLSLSNYLSKLQNVVFIAFFGSFSIRNGSSYCFLVHLLEKHSFSIESTVVFASFELYFFIHSFKVFKCLMCEWHRSAKVPIKANVFEALIKRVKKRN